MDIFIHKLHFSKLKSNYDKIIWENDITKFNSWCNAKTGYPIIDSCMTQLNTTGYIEFFQNFCLNAKFNP